MGPLAAMAIMSAVTAGAGYLQGRQNAKALKSQQREQAKRDRMNMIASAYGLTPTRTSAPLHTNNEWLQGAMAGAQFAALNSDLWKPAVTKPAATTPAMPASQMSPLNPYEYQPGAYI